MIFFIAMFLTIMILFAVTGVIKAWWQSRREMTPNPNDPVVQGRRSFKINTKRGHALFSYDGRDYQRTTQILAKQIGSLNDGETITVYITRVR